MGEASLTNCQHLLREASHILDKEKQAEKLRGEAFNVFSIVGIERDENKHSAFIAELLNPKGSHLQGTVFLKLFLELVPGIKQKPVLNLQKVKVITEKYVGAKDVKNGTGGRIDIFVSDGKNHLSIENKIDAHDQQQQLLRYSNFDRKHHTVYYLTLLNTVPDPKSTKGLKAGEDFLCISYAEHIIKWLELCHKQAVNTPILRENIRQYLLIVKKLTHTLDNHMEDKLRSLVIKNRDSAKLISKHYLKAMNSVREDLRQALQIRVLEKLSKAKIKLGHKTEKDASKRFSSLWFWGEHASFAFAIEPFSGNGHWDGDLFVGYYHNASPLDTDAYAHLEITENRHWPLMQFLTLEEERVNMFQTKFIQLFSDKESDDFKKAVDVLSDQAVNFIQQTNEQLLPTDKVY